MDTPLERVRTMLAWDCFGRASDVYWYKNLFICECAKRSLISTSCTSTTNREACSVCSGYCSYCRRIWRKQEQITLCFTLNWNSLWFSGPLGYLYTCKWSPLSRACQQCFKLKVGRGFEMLHLKSPVSAVRTSPLPLVPLVKRYTIHVNIIR